MKLAPSEFWAMTISEYLHIFEWSRRDEQAGSNLTRGEVDELRELMRSRK